MKGISWKGTFWKYCYEQDKNRNDNFSHRGTASSVLLGHTAWLHWSCACWFLSGESQQRQIVNTGYTNQLRELCSWKNVVATGALPSANFWEHSFELLKACSISYHWRLKWHCMVWVSVYKDSGILWDERLQINIQAAHKGFYSHSKFCTGISGLCTSIIHSSTYYSAERSEHYSATINSFHCTSSSVSRHGIISMEKSGCRLLLGTLRLGHL